MGKGEETHLLHHRSTCIFSAEEAIFGRAGVSSLTLRLDPERQRRDVQEQDLLLALPGQLTALGFHGFGCRALSRDRRVRR